MAILDEEALLATCAYIDLNPVAAGIADVPEASAHTSIEERVDHVASQGRTEELKAARTGSVVGLEEGHRLCPIEDRRLTAREGPGRPSLRGEAAALRVLVAPSSLRGRLARFPEHAN